MWAGYPGSLDLSRLARARLQYFPVAEYDSSERTLGLIKSSLHPEVHQRPECVKTSASQSPMSLNVDKISITLPPKACSDSKENLDSAGDPQ